MTPRSSVASEPLTRQSCESCRWADHLMLIYPGVNVDQWMHDPAEKRWNVRPSVQPARAVYVSTHLVFIYPEAPLPPMVLEEGYPSIHGKPRSGPGEYNGLDACPVLIWCKNIDEPLPVIESKWWSATSITYMDYLGKLVFVLTWTIGSMLADPLPAGGSRIL